MNTPEPFLVEARVKTGRGEAKLTGAETTQHMEESSAVAEVIVLPAVLAASTPIKSIHFCSSGSSGCAICDHQKISVLHGLDTFRVGIRRRICAYRYTQLPGLPLYGAAFPFINTRSHLVFSMENVAAVEQ
ncbi:hypothetical protein V7S43_017272 [Phytophthora oleae]|uniref:Uncharacterized protein n=1 Tax=Phytophthora oleae TaxID=2107226 RepID=A0ABD3EVH8_9STRA